MESLTLTAQQLGHRVTGVEPLPDATLLLQFDGREERLFDLAAFAQPGGIFEPLVRDRNAFRQVRIRGRTIEWAHGETLDPDVLYHTSKPK